MVPVSPSSSSCLSQYLERVALRILSQHGGETTQMEITTFVLYRNEVMNGLLLS
jgi:hypothetical protein